MSAIGSWRRAGACGTACLGLWLLARGSSSLAEEDQPARSAAGAREDRGAVAAFFGPEWIDPRSRLAREIRLLAIRGEVPWNLATFRPNSRIEVARDLAGRRLPYDRAGIHPLWLRVTRELAGELESEGGRPLFGEVRPVYQIPLRPGRLRFRAYASGDVDWEGAAAPDWALGPRLGVAATAHLSPHWSIHEDLFAGRVPGGRRFADALVAHTDYLLLVESAYLGYQSGRFEARAGRLRLHWGPGDGGALLISGEAPPFDQLEWGLSAGNLRFTALSGVLSVPEARNIALHRLEWSPTRRFSLAFAEGALFPGDAFQPLYLAGIVPYTIVERLHGQDTGQARDVPRVRNNVLWELDATIRPAASSLSWVSFLIDDLATENRDMPSRLGTEVGLEFVSRQGRGDLDLVFKWTKVWNYVYSVYHEDQCPCAWTHQGAPLGHPDGPDHEAWVGKGSWFPSRDWRWDATLHLKRKGEGRIGDSWRSAAPAIDAGRLSGVVETRLGGAIGLGWDPSPSVSATLEIGADRVTNSGHVRGGRSDPVYVRVAWDLRR